MKGGFKLNLLLFLSSKEVGTVYLLGQTLEMSPTSIKKTHSWWWTLVFMSLFLSTKGYHHVRDSDRPVRFDKVQVELQIGWLGDCSKGKKTYPEAEGGATLHYGHKITRLSWKDRSAATLTRTVQVNLRMTVMRAHTTATHSFIPPGRGGLRVHGRRTGGCTRSSFR